MNEAEYPMKNYGDRGGCYLSRLQAEADNTLRDLHNFSYDMKAEFNNILNVLLFIQNNSQFKNIIIFDSAHLGLFSSANILQIADVALRVVFLLFLPCFQLSEMPPIFVFTTKTTQARSEVFSVNGALICKEAALSTSSVD